MNNNKVRNSNLELLRIISTLAVLAHHYYTYSGIEGYFDYNHPDTKMVYLKCFSLFGKTAINVFVLITGYFMCESVLKISKLLHLYFEIKFYQILLLITMIALGYEKYNLKDCIKQLVCVLRDSNTGFVSGFLALYVLIPFINVLIQNINQRNHIAIIVIFIFIFTVPRSVLHGGHYSYIGWYFNLYLIGAYFKKYPKTWMKRAGLNGIVLILSIAITLLLTVICIYNNSTLYYWMICESSDILSTIIACSSFLFFNSINISYNVFINTIAKTTFGVFLLHSQNKAVRCNFVFGGGIFAVADKYSKLNFVGLITHSLISIFAVFIICSIIDLIRIYLIERPFFRFLDKKIPYVNKELIVSK